MTNQQDRTQSSSAVRFGSARRRAIIQDILAELAGRSVDLLSFDQVRQQLHLTKPNGEAYNQEIPLANIVGSVGRYREFNRAFLPRSPVDQARWTRIDELRGRASLPPVQVLKVGDVYFVQDGNRRVSVARSRGEQHITARVVDVRVRVPLGPGTDSKDLILKSGCAEFLELTGLDQECPDQCIELTRSGGYRSLLQHIEVHQFYMALRSRKYPALPDATADWYRNVYLPVVGRIQASGVLDHFPSRTDADLYLWIAENRARLQMRYGVRAGEGPEIGNALAGFAQQTRGSGCSRRIRGLILRVLRGSREPELDPPSWHPTRGN